MAKAKSSNTLSTHDRKVREIARNLEKQGYEVHADIRGRKQPEPIGSAKRVPDIEAIKPGHRVLVEVETPSTLTTNQAREQLMTFARHAGQKSDTTLRVIVTKPRKN